MAADWVAIRAEYVAGTDTLAVIAERHGVTPSAIQKRSSREKWGVDRHKKSEEVRRAAEQAAVEKRRDALAEFNEADLSIARALRSMVARKLTEARAANKEIPAKDLRALASTAEAAQKMGRLALGVSTGNVGHGGPNGEGPIGVASVPVDAYLEARQRILSEF